MTPGQHFLQGSPSSSIFSSIYTDWFVVQTWGLTVVFLHITLKSKSSCDIEEFVISGQTQALPRPLASCDQHPLLPRWQVCDQRRTRRLQVNFKNTRPSRRNSTPTKLFFLVSIQHVCVEMSVNAEIRSALTAPPSGTRVITKSLHGLTNTNGLLSKCLQSTRVASTVTKRETAAPPRGGREMTQIPVSNTAHSDLQTGLHSAAPTRTLTFTLRLLTVYKSVPLVCSSTSTRQISPQTPTHHMQASPSSRWWKRADSWTPRGYSGPWRERLDM